MIKMRVEFYLVQEFSSENEAVTTALLDEAGGCTVFEASGAWLSANGVDVDEVLVVQAFMDDTHNNRLKLESLAIQYRIDAKQEAVLYIINCNEFNLVREYA